MAYANESYASMLSKQQIDRIAESIAKQYNYNPETMSIDSFVSQFGARINIEDDDAFYENEHGSCIVYGNKNFEILVPRSTAALRDNFTIAHEFGHYVLHSNAGNNISENDVLVFSRYGSDRLEWEANWFAAGLLMPRELFQRKLREFSGNIFWLASYFNVSTQAASYRADYLGWNF